MCGPGWRSVTNGTRTMPRHIWGRAEGIFLENLVLKHFYQTRSILQGHATRIGIYVILSRIVAKHTFSAKILEFALSANFLGDLLRCELKSHFLHSCLGLGTRDIFGGGNVPQKIGFKAFFTKREGQWSETYLGAVSAFLTTQNTQILKFHRSDKSLSKKESVEVCKIVFVVDQ